MHIAILVLLIMLNGIFAMSEIALVTARPNRLKRLAEKGDAPARRALALGENPTRFLSTIQIGITAIGLLSGIFGEAALAVPLAAWLRQLGLSSSASSAASTAIVVICITYFSIILGELVPKRIAQLSSERIARRVAGPISLLALISSPFVWLLSLSTDGIVRLIGKKDLGDAHLTEEDIHSILAEGAQSGVIEKQEHRLVRNVLRLDDRQLDSLMTPRKEIVWLHADAPPREILRTVLESGISRFPVCRGGLDSILGVITAQKILSQCVANLPINVQKSLQSPVYVPKSLTGLKLLEHFRETGAHLVFVVDEYGSVIGLVTLHDVLVALAGEFKPRKPDERWAIRREDGSWLLDGAIPVLEMKDRLELKTLPEEGKGHYHTLGGLILWLAGSLPRTGDSVAWEDWTFEVVDLDGNRIDKVLAIRSRQD